MRATRVLRVIARLNVGGPSIQAITLSRLLEEHGYETLLVRGREGAREGSMDPLAEQLGVVPVDLPTLKRRIGIGDLARSRSSSGRSAIGSPDPAHTRGQGRSARADSGPSRGPPPPARDRPHLSRPRAYRLLPPADLRGLHGDRADTRALHDLPDRGLGRGPCRSRPASRRAARADRRAPAWLRLLALRCDRRGTSRAARGVPPWAWNPTRRAAGHDRGASGADQARRSLSSRGEQVETSAETWFLVVGDGALREELQESLEAARLGDRLVWAGLRNDMPDVYFGTDVLVVTSDNEGTNVSAIEAQAAGLPVVSTRVGGMPSVVAARHRAARRAGRRGGIRARARATSARR